MLLSMFAFIVLLFCAAVGFDDRRFPPLGAGRSPTGRQLLLTYFALGATAGALALFAGVFPRLRPEPLAAAYSGLILLVGSSGRPWWLFATLRRLRLAVFIDDDRIVRSLFGIAGAVLLVLGIIGLTASTVS